MSDPPPRLRPYVPIDNDGRLAADLPCFDCRYNLRTQHADGRCPECGLAVEQSLTRDNALLMPAFWLGQVVRGSVCIAVSYPLLLLCGIGAIVWLIGVLTITFDPPLQQFRIRNLRRGVLIPLLIAGVAALGVGLTLPIPELLLATCVTFLAALAVSSVTVHLFARKTARAARLRFGARSAAGMAVLTGLLPMAWIGMVAVIVLAEEVWIPYGVADAVPPLMFLMFIGYGVLEMAFWLMFAWSINRVRVEALGLTRARTPVP